MVKQDRNFLKFVILSILTFGIYGLVFWHGYIKDVNVVCGGDGQQTPGLLKLILLSIITCGIYSFFWYFKLGDRLYDNAQSYGLTFKETGSTILLWIVLGSFLAGIGAWVATYILIKNLNSLAEAYNNYDNGNDNNQPPYYY